jgi:hypothetical protein
MVAIACLISCLVTACARVHPHASESRRGPAAVPREKVLRSEGEKAGAVHARKIKTATSTEPSPFRPIPREVRAAMRRVSAISEGMKVGEVWNFLGLKRVERTLFDADGTTPGEDTDYIQYEVGFGSDFIVMCDFLPGPYAKNQSWDQAVLKNVRIFQVEVDELVQSSRLLAIWKPWKHRLLNEASR